MGELAPDILAAARKIDEEGFIPWDDDQHTHEECVLAIARAISAERERCAMIAEMHEHRGVIAAAIRKPTNG